MLRFRHIFLRDAVISTSDAPRSKETLTKKKGPVVTPGLILVVRWSAGQNLTLSDVEIAAK